MPVTAAAQALSYRQRAELAAIFDARQAAVSSAWDAAWGSIADEVVSYADAWAEAVGQFARYSSIPYARRMNLEASINHVTTQLANVNTSTAQQTLKALELVTPRAEGDALALAQAQSGMVPWLPTDPKAVDAIVKRATQQITVRSYALSASATSSVRSALRVGVAAGDNPRRIARQMVKLTEGVFNGGLARAEVIARTEVMDAYRAASHETYQANGDLLTGWTWLCELSDRSCASCIAMDGSVHDLQERGPNDHHQGRCTSVPNVKTRAELNLPGPEPKAIERDAIGWLKSQPESTQQRILGDRGYRAWKAGNYPPSKWSQLVQSPDWRPAYHTTTPPEPKAPTAPRTTPRRPSPQPQPPAPRVTVPATPRPSVPRPPSAAPKVTPKSSELFPSTPRTVLPKEPPKPVNITSHDELIARLEGVNPVSKIGNNCSNCAPSYELKLRDDVNRVAKFRPKGRSTSDCVEAWARADGTKLDWLRDLTDLSVMPRAPGGRLLLQSAESTVAKVEREFLGVLTEDGQRALVLTSWRGGGGHIMNAARVNGRVTLYDAQTAKSYELDWLVKHAATAQVMRVDNLTFIADPADYYLTEKAAAAYVRKQEALKAAKAAKLAAARAEDARRQALFQEILAQRRARALLQQG